jgi:hypothetical protein
MRLRRHYFDIEVRAGLALALLDSPNKKAADSKWNLRLLVLNVGAASAPRSGHKGPSHIVFNLRLLHARRCGSHLCPCNKRAPGLSGSEPF